LKAMIRLVSIGDLAEERVVDWLPSAVNIAAAVL
jgi:hypothetical protein